MKEKRIDPNQTSPEARRVGQARAEFELAAQAFWEANRLARATGSLHTSMVEAETERLLTAQQQLKQAEADFTRASGGPPPVESTEIVAKKVRQSFDEDKQADALRLLATECARNLPFLKDADAKRLEQIQLAVIKLAGGSLPELRRQIAVAQKDWRDVITLAETPEAVGLGLVEITKLDEKTRREVEARDRAQYLAWLNEG